MKPRMKDINEIFYLCVVIFCVKSAGSTCTFPENLRGSWISSDKGTLNFTDNAISNYPLRPPLSALLTFTCKDVYQDLYFLWHTNYEVFAGVFVNIFLCLDLKEISTTKYIYSLICGAVESRQAMVTCPSDFLATFTNFTVMNSSGAIQCTGNSLDVCRDRTAMNYTCSSCLSSVAFSCRGYFYCLYYQADSTTGVTYLHVNNNSTLVSRDNYRIVCYAFKKSGDIVYSTEYPGSCHVNQNETYVNSPGLISQYYGITESCAVVATSNVNNLTYTPVIVVSSIGLVILIIIIHKQRRKCTAIYPK